MAKTRSATQAQKTGDKKQKIIFPDHVTCDGCLFFEQSKTSSSIAYCHKIKMPIAATTQKRCIHKKLK